MVATEPQCVVRLTLTVYRQPRPANDNDLALMRRIDELFTRWPFFGSRRITAMLRSEGTPINRKRVQRLMRQMGIAALGPKPRTTMPAPGHKICHVRFQGLRTQNPARLLSSRLISLM